MKDIKNVQFETPESIIPLLKQTVYEAIYNLKTLSLFPSADEEADLNKIQPEIFNNVYEKLDLIYQQVHQSLKAIYSKESENNSINTLSC